ncbi:UPF0729 protein AAEL015238-like [Mytilus trossulus]|uniref:UPF0729 protein AAEL015238-like n=1 Tax=Mytilus trossulus TaxID=6551 RepID=UPI003006E914
MVCCPCFVIPFLFWFFHRYLRPLMEKFCPSMIKYLPGNSKNEGEESKMKCPMKKTDETQIDENSTSSKSGVTAGDGGTKKTN